MNENMAWEGWKASKWGKGNHVKSAKANYRAKAYSKPVTSIRILKWQTAQKRHVILISWVFFFFVGCFCLFVCLFLSTLWTSPLLHGMLEICCISEELSLAEIAPRTPMHPFFSKWFLRALKAIIPVSGAANRKLLHRNPVVAEPFTLLSCSCSLHPVAAAQGATHDHSWPQSNHSFWVS